MEKKGSKQQKTVPPIPQIALGPDRYLHHLDDNTVKVIRMFLISVVVTVLGVVLFLGPVPGSLYLSAIIGKGKAVVEYLKKNNRSG
ncbi:hypothetical protein [Flavihumibacter solisilvae]|nr:hypothetical protein [Flavihumibacter solisilvae]